MEKSFGVYGFDYDEYDFSKIHDELIERCKIIDETNNYIHIVSHINVDCVYVMNKNDTYYNLDWENYSNGMILLNRNIFDRKFNECLKPYLEYDDFDCDGKITATNYGLYIYSACLGKFESISERNMFRTIFIEKDYDYDYSKLIGFESEFSYLYRNKIIKFNEKITKYHSSECDSTVILFFDCIADLSNLDIISENS